VTGLFRRSRAYKIVLSPPVLGPVSFLIGMVSGRTLAKYTATGNAVLIVLFMLFAAWAWWYAEDRDRRSALKEPQRGPDNDSG
jgi:positive regulator of sigma E activity